MRCTECGFRGELRIERGDYDFEALPGTVLRDVEHRTCPECGSIAVVIPALAELTKTLASLVVRKASPLTPAEFRFLRKALGWSGQDTAKRLGVQAETVSRWEHGKRVIGPTADRLIRLCVVAFDPITDYSAEALEWEADGAAEAAKTGLVYTRRAWRVAA